MVDNDVRLSHPYTMLCGGATSTGKSHFALEIIRNVSRILSPVPRHIIVAYGQWQPAYERISTRVKFHKGMPKSVPNDTLLVVDDLMLEDGDLIADIFTRRSHHSNISIIYITQNIFHKAKYYRLISLNAQYIALFKSPRDILQPMILGRQMFPHNFEAFKTAYNLATESPYGYLFIDVRPTCPEAYRLRTDILNAQGQTIFVPTSAAIATNPIKAP